MGAITASEKFSAALSTAALLTFDSSKSFELHSKNPEIKLKCEAILGTKVNKIIFFQDFFFHTQCLRKR